jgi:hypothetical protein
MPTRAHWGRGVWLSVFQSAEASGTTGQVPTPIPTQARPELQVRTLPPSGEGVRQQGCPPAPHATHDRTPIIALPHTVPAAVQVLPVQQTSPTAPQAWQVRPAPPPAAPQIAPVAVHVLLAQHGWPALPQISQLTAPSTTTHPLPAAVHCPFPAFTTPPAPQHAWPIPPHAVHVGPPESPTTFWPTQVLAVQLLPVQQG